MIKDARVQVRINKKIKEQLKKDGWVVQKIVDEFIERLYKIELLITNTKKGSKK